MRITVIEGHPFSHSFGRALSDAYIDGAFSAGHEVRKLDIRELQLPSKVTFGYPLQTAYQPKQDEIFNCIDWSDHLVVVNPIWLGPHNYGLNRFFERSVVSSLRIADRYWAHDQQSRQTIRSARLLLAGEDRMAGARCSHHRMSLNLMQNICQNYCGNQKFNVTAVDKVQRLSKEERSLLLQKIARLGVEAR